MMATPSTTTVVNTQHQMQSNGDVCDVCWKKDGWMRDRKKNGLKLLRCKQCGVCVHAECYGWAEPLLLDHHDGSEFTCWACLAVGTVVKVRERDAKTGERKQIRITERPTECCLCSVDEGMQVPHAMHPMFDDYGLWARQILLPAAAEKGGGGDAGIRRGQPLRNHERTAWAHTICCMVLSSSTGGVVYGLTRDGAFDGENDDNDDRIQDDESINSVLGDSKPKCKSAATITHFGHIVERFYKKGSVYLKNRKEYQSLKCIECGANDQAKHVYRIPIQCAAGDKNEHADFHGCHADLGTDTCYQAMHVGCAFYGKNEYGEYPAVRRVYYFPGQQDERAQHYKVVANCFCLKHAQDVSTLPGCGSTRYPKGTKKAPRLHNHPDASSKNTQSLLWMEGASEQMDPAAAAAEPRRRHSSAQNKNTKPQSSKRLPTHQHPLQSKQHHSQQQQHHHLQLQHTKRSSETTRAKSASTPSGSEASSAALAAPNAGDSSDDLEVLVAELRNTSSKIGRTIMKKKWRRIMANFSSDKFNVWWKRALEQSKGPPCETTTTNAASTSRADLHHDDSNRHLGEEQHLQRPSIRGDEDRLIHEMIQAVSEALAQLGEDKKNNPELVRETVHEKRTMFRKQHDSMSKADFNGLWRHVREKVGQMHGIIIRPFKKRNSEQQQGTRKLPPDVANAIAAAAADADAAVEPPMKKQRLATADASCEPPEKKHKSQHQQQQQQQEQQTHVGTDGSSMATDPKKSVGDRKASTATSTLATASIINHATLKTSAESKNNDDVNNEKQTDSSMDEEGEPATEQHLLTAEQIRFQNMVQDVDDESAAQRHQVPLQVILKKQRQQWEHHLVHEGPIPARLSDLEFASLWKTVEQRACKNWQRRIQTATTTSVMDWNFLVFGKHYDAEKTKAYCNEWDTMNSDEI